MPPRRLWCSCIVLGYLSGQQDIQHDCELIINQAQGGDLEIIVSTLAQAEVAYIEGVLPDESERRIREFFSRDYIVTAAFDMPVARIARRLIRDHARLRPPDAIHLATAALWNIPIVETTDPDLLRLDKITGNPPIVVRRPLYEGAQPLPGFTS